MEPFPHADDAKGSRPTVTMSPPTSAERSRSDQQTPAPNTLSVTTTFPTITTTTAYVSRAPSPRMRTTVTGEPRENAVTNRPALPRPHSIRLKRLPSSPSIRQVNDGRFNDSQSENNGEWGVRRRSISEPPQPELYRPATRSNPMEPLAEETTNPVPEASDLDRPVTTAGGTQTTGSRLRSASDAARRRLSLRSIERREEQAVPGQYESDVVDLLDVVDPEVSTLTTLTNVQNSLFVPDLGRFLNRRPTYELSRRPTTISEKDTPSVSRTASRYPVSRNVTRYTTTPEKPLPEVPDEGSTMEPGELGARPSRTQSITSVMTDSHYAVLPHGVKLEGWTDEDMEELNDHVRHMLHSRRSKFKRSMKAFGKYMSKPLGFCVTLYATLITLFGLAWVLFLIGNLPPFIFYFQTFLSKRHTTRMSTDTFVPLGWINVGGRQYYIINVIDNVLVALFAIVGDGLAPFRAVDTYHMCFIAHYHHLTWRLRREQALPELHDHNDLPAVIPMEETDIEKMAREEKEYSLLTETQQKKLEHHQAKFSKSHSFYKPHETTTHRAFPLRLLVAVVVLLDCHSLFQIALGTCTWAISYHHRPGALTATILCCSICSNITAGILITVGDRKSRKTEVVKQMFRQELTEEALNKVRKNKSEREGKNLNVIRSASESDVVGAAGPNSTGVKKARKS